MGSLDLKRLIWGLIMLDLWIYVDRGGLIPLLVMFLETHGIGAAMRHAHIPTHSKGLRLKGTQRSRHNVCVDMWCNVIWPDVLMFR